LLASWGEASQRESQVGLSQQRSLRSWPRCKRGPSRTARMTVQHAVSHYGTPFWNLRFWFFKNLVKKLKWKTSIWSDQTGLKLWVAVDKVPSLPRGGHLVPGGHLGCASRGPQAPSQLGLFSLCHGDTPGQAELFTAKSI
jgi:hypothetical protein